MAASKDLCKLLHLSIAEGGTIGGKVQGRSTPSTVAQTSAPPERANRATQHAAEAHRHAHKWTEPWRRLLRLLLSAAEHALAVAQGVPIPKNPDNVTQPGAFKLLDVHGNKQLFTVDVGKQKLREAWMLSSSLGSSHPQQPTLAQGPVENDSQGSCESRGFCLFDRLIAPRR